MKTTINLYASLLFAFLFVCQASFGQKEEKEEHTISFSSFNHRAEIDKGIWFGTIEEEKVCIQLMDSKNRSNPSFMISLCIPVEEFTLNTAEGFELNKPSGSIKFQGAFPNDKGNGDFTFAKNREFEAFLNKEGISTNNDDRYKYFKLFLGDVSKEYVLGLKRHGYKPTLKQLGRLGIHDVEIEYINSIANTNYKGLELDMLLKFAIHDISIDYIKDLEKAGYGNIDANMLKKFAIHDVSIDYINGLTRAGYSNLDPNMIKNFAVHDITLDYIQDLSRVGFANLEPRMLKNFAVHDISPKYIKSLQDTGISDVNPNSYKKAKIHGLTARYIKSAQADGHNSNELSDYIKLKIHGK
ncbi:hypothetical protein FEE95_07680 [Maribacter algarum]|uniref:Uncharacterized protein n=1 Tax=Maribacter algarum (ex Zhang et al. 2020) TaxID=2578118 RepID=A0A5S3PWF6_9FLAO|nr:hypothetical protein [Maribacter algarum]TMM59303.1 hypothetical protein FEE95_07680 [Maribacter algarum]